MKIRTLLEDVTPSEIAELVRKDCGSYLDEVIGSEDRVMYRGMKPSARKHAVLKPLSDRKPTHTAEELHKAIDDGLHELTGIRFRTDSTIFCTGDRSQAADYGTVFMVFPVGKFDYCWSPKIYDVFINLDIPGLNAQHWVKKVRERGTLNISDEVEADLTNGDHESYIQLVHDSIASGAMQYQFNRGLRTALRSESEIMVRCKEYHAIRASYGEFDAEFAKELFK